jgi:hypothetical protein
MASTLPNSGNRDAMPVMSPKDVRNVVAKSDCVPEGYAAFPREKMELNSPLVLEMYWRTAFPTEIAAGVPVPASPTTTNRVLAATVVTGDGTGRKRLLKDSTTCVGKFASLITV